jgi:hypothetical protein
VLLLQLGVAVLLGGVTTTAAVAATAAAAAAAAAAATAAALEWACVLHLALLCVHWAPEVLESLSGREVYGPQGELLFRGIRARVGIYKVTGTAMTSHVTAFGSIDMLTVNSV